MHTQAMAPTIIPIIIPIVILTVSPLWLKSPKWVKLQLYLLVTAVIWGMVSLTPSKAFNSAPFNKYPPLMIAQFSCGLVISLAQFCATDGNPRRRFGDNSCICLNENALATLAYCYETGYPQEVESLMAMCNRDYNASLTREKFDSSLQYYRTNAKELPHNHSTLGNEVVDFPIKISESRIELFKHSYDQFLGNYNRSMDYGWYMVVFWGAVFGMATIGNWTKVLLPNMTKRFNGPIVRSIRSSLTLPALRGKERTAEKPLWKVLDFLQPTRAETLVVAAFSILVVHLTFYNIRFTPGDPIFGTKLAALMRCFAVRTGIIASSLLPLSVLFAGRNNVLQWITRWEYSTFVMFHRWLSRVMVLLLIVHSIGYSGHLLRPWPYIKTYVLFGVLGTFSGIAILVQGLLVLRRKWYEAFLAIHVVLAGAFVVGAWRHVLNLHFLWYFYVSACFWGFDRIIRIQRLCVFGFPLAEIRLYEDDTLKFHVPTPAGFQAEGGGHCFVHFLQWPCFWQSHPFTYTVVDGNVVFYVKVKEGVTARLKTYLEAHPKKAAYMRVAVEGSYGEATPAHRYDSSVFFAGGNGIPGIFAEAVEVVESHRKSLSTRKVKLIWVVRDYASLLWFYDELNSLREMAIDTEIYVTRPQARLTGIASDKSALLENTYSHRVYYMSESVEDPVEELKKDLAHVTFCEGRPDIEKAVARHVDESVGSTCFVTCGHPIMVDEIRYEVVQEVATSRKRVDYFEQLQVWA